jgi:hypothetical protein
MRKIRTYPVELAPPVKTLAADFALPTALVDEKQLLAIEAKAVRYPLKQETVATETIKFPARPKTLKVDPAADIPKKVGTRRYKIKPPARVGTLTISMKFNNMGGRVKRVPCKPPEKLKTYKSNRLDYAPIIRKALNRKRIPFPVISDFMSELAERHKTSYTNVKYVGIFDPVPLHLAEKMMIDTEMGILKFHIRKEPKGERRFVRMVYGRRRDTGEIISAVFPVT